MKRSLILLLSVFIYASLWAQEDTIRVSDLWLDEVEVVVLQDAFGPNSHPVQTIGHAQIAALPISNISDVLAYLPALDVRSRGEGMAQADVSLYGGTFDQVQILLNGIPISDAQTGHYAMNIPLTPALIERIEIRQGDASLHTGALAGAINIITRDVHQDDYTLQLSAGTNGLAHPSFTGSWRRDAARIHASAEYARSNGYYAPTEDAKEKEAIANTDYQLANLYFQTRWDALRHHVDVQADR